MWPAGRTLKEVCDRYNRSTFPVVTGEPSEPVATNNRCSEFQGMFILLYWRTHPVRLRCIRSIRPGPCLIIHGRLLRPAAVANLMSSTPQEQRPHPAATHNKATCNQSECSRPSLLVASSSLWPIAKRLTRWITPVFTGRRLDAPEFRTRAARRSRAIHGYAFVLSGSTRRSFCCSQ